MKKSIWIAVLVLVLDRLTKILAMRLQSPVPLIPGVVRLTCVQNTGVAFSLLAGHSRLLGLITPLLIAVVWLFVRRCRQGPWSRTGLMLALGGCVGNMVDRILSGSVTDMVELLFVRFAVFNLADAALVIGAVLVGISLCFCPKEWEKKS